MVARSKIRLTVRQVSKLLFLWEFPKACKVLIAALVVLLVGLISTVPGCVQVVVEVADFDFERPGTITLVARKIPYGFAELFSSFVQVEKNCISIHKVVG
jgi:hypothetical protein